MYANLGNNSIVATTFVGSLVGTNVSGNGANLTNLTGANLTGTVNATALQQNTSSVTTVYPTFSTSGSNGNSAAVINAAISANLANGAILATTFSGNVVATTLGGALTTAAQPNITSTGTLTSVAVTGNANVGNLNATTAVIASTLTSNIATGTAPLTVTSTTRVANLNVDYANVADFVSVTTATSGNAFLLLSNAVTGNITESANSVFVANSSNGAIHATTFVGALSGAATTAGTVTTAAQPNITSIGVLSSLGVTGNASVGNLSTSGISNLGSVSNVRITGGTANFVLRTDGAGNLSWVAQSGGGASANIPPNDQTSAYTLVLSDVGKYINITTGGVTVPASVFSSGDTLSIYNNSASNQTITQGAGVTMYSVGTATTGNRTLAQRGLATLLCVGANTFVITGGGLT
jgi:hypothetical protein